jgi:hypothetical protein
MRMNAMSSRDEREKEVGAAVEEVGGVLTSC